MSKNFPVSGTTLAIEPTNKAPLLDPAAFEAYAAAARQSVAEGLARRALMAQAPPSKAKH
jgi:hypothetical protein